MAIDVETFGRQLIKAISDRFSHSGGYILSSDLITALQKALLADSGGSAEFPKMLYMGLADSEKSARRVLLHSPGEERRFREVTDDAIGWMPDPNFFYGGVAIGLDQLVAEHAALLHQELDEQLAAGGPEVLAAEVNNVLGEMANLPKFPKESASVASSGKETGNAQE